MKLRIVLLVAATATAAAPVAAMASPVTGQMVSGPRIPSPTTAPGNGQYNGAGYNHTNSGRATGQPNQSCETTGTTPGNAGSAPGGGSAFAADSNSGAHYAGSQLQNSRNSASVSQYDVACSNQPH